MTTLFVTATGTEVGKTFVATLLIRGLLAAGRSVAALKPVASGYDATQTDRNDTGRLLRALGRPLDPRNVADVTPWRFVAPLSPDMAAAREGRSIEFARLTEFCRRPRAADVTLIEGIGGVMVPLDERHTVLDLIVAVDAPVLLVAGSYLGTLSHTLSAAALLSTHGGRLAGIVINESAEQPVTVEETAEVVRRFTGVPVVALRRHEAGEEASSPDALLALVG